MRRVSLSMIDDHGGRGPNPRWPDMGALERKGKCEKFFFKMGWQMEFFSQKIDIYRHPIRGRFEMSILCSKWCRLPLLESTRIRLTKVCAFLLKGQIIFIIPPHFRAFRFGTFSHNLCFIWGRFRLDSSGLGTTSFRVTRELDMDPF